ncbi:hypothetical protein BN2537_16399 [Streptomyces venezuelae]|nr:hypothetical protein BN2537_16399 [Streptomyces venezuelae]
MADVSATLGTRSPGELFEHLLIDVEMSACLLGAERGAGRPRPPHPHDQRAPRVPGRLVPNTALSELRLSVKDPTADDGPARTTTLTPSGGPTAPGLTVHRHQGDLDEAVTDDEATVWELAVRAPADPFTPPQDLVLLCDYTFTLAP